MRNTHGADLHLPGGPTRSFACGSGALRPSILAVALLIGGAARAEWRQPTLFEGAALAAAETSLLLDALQTRDIKNHFYQHETNPLLGPQPSDARVALYFGTAALLTAGAWYALPSGWRFLVPIAVLAIQVPRIVLNAQYGCVIRF